MINGARYQLPGMSATIRDANSQKGRQSEKREDNQEKEVGDGEHS